MKRAALTASLLGLLSGCATDYHMGEAIQPDAVPSAPRAAQSAPGAPIAPRAQSAPSAAAPAPAPHKMTGAERKLQQQASEWEAKWQQIEGPKDRIDWVDHARVCALKYRYRSYDQLFRCLDLLEAKVARAKSLSHPEQARRVVPVFAGWLRSIAYAELGEPELALKWAETAWAAVPREYQQASSRLTASVLPLDADARQYLNGAMRLGGSSTVSDSLEETNARFGRDNPAGLDMSPGGITMSLTAERAILYQHLGETAKAQAALDELHKWEHLRKHLLLVLPNEAPFMLRAWLLSLGPLFAMGRYGEVVEVYERDARWVSRDQTMQKFANRMQWVMFAPVMALGEGLNKAYDATFSASDIRLFTVASEDASNALIYAQSLEHIGKSQQARAMYDKLLAMPELPAMGNLYWVTLYQRGLIALREGKEDDALKLLTQAVDAIESVRSSISVEAAKIGFAGDKQAVYGTLVGVLAKRGDWNGAFLAAERAKARALVDLLAQQRDLPAPAAADDKLRALFASAQTSEASVGFPQSASAVRGIKVIAESRASLGQIAPEAASLVAVQKLPLEAITGRIAADETLIDYYASGDDLYAFVVSTGRVKGFRLSAAGLNEEVRAFREAIARRDPSTPARAQALHRRLLEPLLPELHGEKLTISPNGALHYLPFAALQQGDQYLIDRFSLRLTPSASALAYLRSDRPIKPGALLAVGNPDLGNPTYDLPNAQVEAVKVAGMFPKSQALLRAQASKSAVKELGSSFAMLHFATHGKFDTEAPLSSGLYLAKGTEPDGVLTVNDLYSLRWDIDLVTLSACETALGKVANGDDVIGLTRGFLYAGARSIVASLWEVDDAATAELMVSFYGHLEGHSKREALRLAQIETRAKYPQPVFWAAFQVVGDAQ